MFSDNIQYQTQKPPKVLLIANEEKLLLKGMFTGRELSAFVGRKVITTSLDTNENLSKQTSWHMSWRLFSASTNSTTLTTWKTESLLRNHVTANEEFTSFEPVTPQYKKLKYREFTSLTMRITDQKGNSITDGLGITIVLHIR